MTGENQSKVAPPSAPSSARIKSRPSRTGIDWEALEAAQAARFASLPADATDDELAARNAEIDADKQRPGRLVPLMDRWNGRKWVVWKERYITDEDLAAFTKKPTSASVSTRAARSELRPPSPPPEPEKGSVDYDNKKLPEGSGSGSAEFPEKGSVKGSGSGYELPELENVSWEAHKKGGWEAWHSPDGAFHRKDKTYLGHVGKRQLAAWGKLSPDDSRAAVVAWIAEKRAAKGIG